IILGYYLYAINYTRRGIINNILNKREGKILNNEFNEKIKSANLSTDYTVEQANGFEAYRKTYESESWLF
ncbi:hypothetical protein ABHA59_17220, partial [Clostridium tertium]